MTSAPPAAELTAVARPPCAHGEVIEDTYDWYAHDRWDNVWYLGEDTKEYENGRVVSTEGSWEAGVDGAQAGVIVPASPEVGLAYRQEYYAGQAEDAHDHEVSGDRVPVEVHIVGSPFGICVLHVLLDRHRDVLGKIRRHPLGPVRRDGDDEFFLVLGEQSAV